MNSIGEVVNQQIDELMTAMTQYEAAAAEKHRVYHNFLNYCESEALDSFVTGIC